MLANPNFPVTPPNTLLYVRLQHNFGNRKLSVYTKFCFISLYTQCEMKLKNAHIFLGITCKKNKFTCVNNWSAQDLLYLVYTNQLQLKYNSVCGIQ